MKTQSRITHHRIHRHIRTPLRAIIGALIVCAALLPLLVLPGQSMAQPPTISFGVSGLQGTTGLNNPTKLQFGPDNRLYVTQQDGMIYRYTVVRNGPNNYEVTAVENITLVQSIQNHNDDGTTAGAPVNQRQVTGLLVTGTAANPVLYVSSSDPRRGVNNDTNLDTNSGTITRLTWNGSSWDKFDIVRGLPRSEEYHSVNGIALDQANGMLYLAVGGHANMGAPSNALSHLPEFALSAAILSINLNMIGSTTYDLPTLDDPARPNVNGITDPSAPGYNGVDVGDPFGGNDGANQAIIVPGGPVQVYSPGYRNSYDVIITEAGRMYTIDNGSNSNWGGPPIGEGTPNCTNDSNETGSLTTRDNLHYIPSQGYYAGHPNPTRGNMNNTWNGQSPVALVGSNPVECDYRQSGVDDGALATWGYSTNGMAEYVATNFGGQLRGNLLAAGYNGSIQRIVLNAAGDVATNVSTLFSSFGSTPLDVTAQGDLEIFPGTVWAATYGANRVTVFEPADYSGVNNGVCTGAYSLLLDEDGDGYSNADEIDNGTNPCSAADRPPDNDNDGISDLNDDDDDNDGIPDRLDAFAIDPYNGLATSLPLHYSWNGGHPHFGLFDSGFTGLMMNRIDDYLDQFDLANMTVGGAAGVLTVDEFNAGTSFQSSNTQDYGFQFGVNVNASTQPFTVHTRILAPYFNAAAPQAGQTMGVYIGSGDQDNYLKLVLDGSGGGSFGVVMENNGVATSSVYPASYLASSHIDLYLSVNPATGTVQPKYVVDDGAVVLVGSPIVIPAGTPLYNSLTGAPALAVGILGSTGGAGPTGATWDFIEVTLDQPSVLGASPTSVDFGSINTGSNATETVTLTNMGSLGDPAVQISNLATSGNFSLVNAPALPLSLAPGQSVTVDVRYTPAAAGSHSSNLVVTHNGSNTPLNIPLSGIGLAPQTILHRVNAGGPLVSASPMNWAANTGNGARGTAGSAQGAVNTGQVVTSTFSGTNNTGAPNTIFNTERYDAPASPEMMWSFTVPAGQYEVRLYLAETYTAITAAGQRVFNVRIEGNPVLTNFDQFAEAGYNAIVKSFTVNVTDGTLNIEFIHVQENPTVKGIEILTSSAVVPPPAPSPLGVSPNIIPFGSVVAGSTSAPQTVTLTNNGAAGTSNVVISSVGVSGSSAFAHNFTGPVTLTPGQSATFNVTFTPPTDGLETAILQIVHNGSNTSPANVSLSGLGVGAGGAGLSVSPTPIDFGPTNIGGAPATQVITLTNNQSQPLTVASVSLTGPDAAHFSHNFASSFSIPGNGSTTLNVNFAPTTNGPKTATLQIAHTGSNTSPVTIPLSGEGIILLPTPVISYRVNSGGAQLAATDGGPVWSVDTVASPSPYVNAAATGNTVYSVTRTINMSGIPAGVSVPAALFQTERYDAATAPEMAWNFPVGAGNTYVVRLYLAEIWFTAGGSRSFDVFIEGNQVLNNFDPFTAAGGRDRAILREFTVTVMDDNLNIDFTHEAGGDNPAIKGIEIIQIGTATPLPADVTANTAVLDFGSITTGTTGTPQTVTLSNTGAAGARSLTVSAVSITGADAAHFTHTFSTPLIIAAGGTATLDVNFVPTTDGAKSAVLNIVHDGDSGTALTINLTGTATPPPTSDLSAAPAPLAFGSITTGTTGTAQTITLSNTGVAGAPDITVSVVSITGADATHFTHTFTTPLIIAAGGTATLDVNFVPTTDGAKAAVLEIAHNGNNATPLTVNLTGTATAPLTSSLNATPSPLAFGSVSNGSSAAQTITLTNTGPAGAPSITVSGVTITGADAGQFSHAFIAPVTIAAGGTATFNVSFAPTVNGPKTAALEITHDGVNASPVAVDLTGSGAPIPAAGTVLYRVNAGGPQAAAADGTAPLWSVDTIANPSSFSNHVATGNRVSGTTATIDMTHPSMTSSAPMSLFQSQRFDAADTPAEMQWAFPVTAGNTYLVRLYFSEHFFTAANLRVFDVSLEGNQVLNDYDIFAAAGGQNRAIVESFTVTPADNILNIDFLRVVGKDNPAIRGIEIIETAIAPPTASLGMSLPALDFGSITTGTTGTPQALTLSNTGAAGAPDLTISSITLTGTDAGHFTHTFTTPLIIPAGGTATVNVNFAPTTDGAKSAALEIAHNGSNASPATIALTGTATAPLTSGLTAGPAALDFGSLTTGTTGTPQAVTLTNNGAVGAPSITVSAVSITGADAGQFSHNFAGAITIPAGGTATVNVNFAPTTDGAKSAVLEIAHNGVNASPVTVSLAGVGTTPLTSSLTVGPASLDFGSITTGTTGTPQAVTLTNSGTVGAPDIMVAAISLTGADAGQFSHDFAAAITIPAGGTATVNVNFAPTSDGAKTAALEILHNGVNASPVTVSLAGAGVSTPVASLQVVFNALDFGTILVGGSAPAQTLTFTNSGAPGSADIVISDISFIGGDTTQFSHTFTAPIAIPAGGSVTVDVGFAPTSDGFKSVDMQIVHNGSNVSPVILTFQGTGSLPGLQVSPGSLNFGPVAIQAANQLVTLTNTNGAGTPDITVSAVNITGANAAEFTHNFAAPIILAPGASATLNVTFAPVSLGAKSAALEIIHDGPNASPITVTLTGSGEPAPVAGTPPTTPVNQPQQTAGTFTASDPFITKNANPPFAIPGEAVTFTFVISNPGSVAAVNIVAVDPMPAQVEIISATAPVGTVTVEGQNVVFRRDVLQPGEVITVTIQTRVRASAVTPFVITNEVCLNADNMSAESCATARVLSISTLPSTGQSPWSMWRLPIFALAISMFFLLLAGSYRKMRRALLG